MEVSLQKEKGLSGHFRCFKVPCSGREAGAWGGKAVGKRAGGKGVERVTLPWDLGSWEEL